jgi:hypothetical protein
MKKLTQRGTGKTLGQILDRVDRSSTTEIIELKPRARRKRRVKRLRAQKSLDELLGQLVVPNPTEF